MSNVQIISDPSDLRKYRTELPNLYDDSDLDPYEFRLLVHYKRVGECTESLETTARICKMSEGKISQARQSLAEKGFIHLERVAMDAGRYRYVVTIIDRWIENFARYSRLPIDEISRQIERVSQADSPSPHEASPSPHEGKKELFKNLDLVINAGAIAKIYEQEIGALTPLVADAIHDACETYPPDWIPEAISIAVENNARNWSYILAILKNCKAKGKRPMLNKLEAKHGNNGKGDRKGARPKQPRPNAREYSDADRAAADAINSAL